jgi:hypothetical protein
VCSSLGPPGIYRKIAVGWLDYEDRDLGDDASSTEHSEFSSDSSDLSDPSNLDMTDLPPEGEEDEDEDEADKAVQFYPNFLGREDRDEIARSSLRRDGFEMDVT